MRRTIGIGAAALLALLIPAGVLAKEGNLTTATIDTGGTPPHAGAAVHVGISILITHQVWNGSGSLVVGAPEPWTGPTAGTSLGLIAENTNTHHTVWATAVPDGAAGHYAADVTFPSEGAWRFVVRAGDPTRAPGPLERIVMTGSILRILPPLPVAPVVEPKPAQPPVTVPAQPAPMAEPSPVRAPAGGLPGWLVPVLLAAACMAVGTMALVRRGTVRGGALRRHRRGISSAGG